jgi:pyrroline-5-carboxylate reductase
MTALPGVTWFVGCGHMAGAMVEGWRAGGVDLSQAIAIRPSGRAVEGVRTVSTLGEAGREPKLVILGFKPQQLDEVAMTLEPLTTHQTVIVSMLAGVEIASLWARFPNARAIVRAMPNLPVSVRRGVVALYGEDVDNALSQQLANLFGVLGHAPWMTDEAGLASVGSVAGAGPAYVARFVDALAKAGVARGLSETMAKTVALETVLGTVWMAAATRETMDDLAKRVASPNGTTEAGLAVLDHDRVLDQLVAVTIEAAARRGAELAAAARPH